MRELLDGADIAEYADQLNERVTEWADKTPVWWANESNAVARAKVYEGVPADGPPPKLTPEYVEAAKPVVDEQLVRAGVRLAMLLNQSVGSDGR